MKLAIAIPALNEEKSIAGVIEQALAARETIARDSSIEQVEIIVVSDGSTDRTVELASRYKDRINLIVFEHNRGYGAAIQEAWRQSDAEILGFMDADGTCDPPFFGTLCSRLFSESADIVLGCRLTSHSKMPLLRRIGNAFFASLLMLFSLRRVRDAASGMRVVRRSCLPDLMPLPDGLHFTPAMTARAVLSNRVKLVEIDMPYHEREGRSKLSVLKDGVRFTRVIFEEAFLFRPYYLLALLGSIAFLIAAILMINPTFYYAQNRSVLEWMIYRFIASNLLATSSVLLLCVSHSSRKIVSLTVLRDQIEPAKNMLDAFFASPFFWLVPVLFTAVGAVLVEPSVEQLVTTGATYEHWSRFIVMSFLVSAALILSVTRLLDYTLELIGSRLTYLKTRGSAET